MFCPFCGAQVMDGASFCNACGGNITGAPAPAPNPAPAYNPVDYQAQKNAVRESEMTALAKTIDHFNLKKNEFDQYDAVCQLVNYYSRGAKKSLIVWGGICFFFGIIVAVASSSAVPALLFCLPGALMIAGGLLMQINSKKKYEFYQAEYARLSQELYEHYMAYPNCPVGAEYANPDILEVLMSYLQSGRADTIKESINVAISEATRAEMNDYLATIQANTEAINSQTKVAAFFAAANYFK